MRQFSVGRALQLAVALGFSDALQAQTSAPAEAKVRVFIDCAVRGCDADYFRTEITFVDHVRDRADADVHVLVTTQRTGGGGADYALAFIGRAPGARIDTLHAAALNSATPDERRQALVRVIKLGLVPFVAPTGAGQLLDVTLLGKSSAAKAAGPKPGNDPWNFWVFRISSNMNFSGEETQRFAIMNGSASANRITDAWKVSVRTSGTYNESKFTFADGSKFANYAHTYAGSELIVKSLNPHWSLGQRATVGSSTFLNQKLSLRFAPAIEYNVFPYSEATRRQLTLQYAAGLAHYRYEELTIYDKLTETHPENTLTASLSLKQPWGSVSSSLEGATLLDDLSKRRLVNFTSLDLKLFKGFNLNLFSSVSLIRDQLYIPAGDLSDEEVLVRRRRLASSYNYFAGFGISYTFGSIFNNVVNPRFGGSGGGIFIIE